LGLVLGGCFAAVACSSDSDDSSAAGGTGGAGGTHSAAGTSSGASAGKASGGSSAGGGENSAGTAGSTSNAGAGEGGAPLSGEAGVGGEAGAPVAVVVPPPLLDPYTVVVTNAAPTTFNHVLVTGTDYATKGEVASVRLSPIAIEDSTSYPDRKGDVIAVGSGGLGFVLQRSEGKVNLVDGSKIKTTFDIAALGTGVPADLSHKAYVPSYNYNFISVLDLAAGTVTGRIDLSQFQDPKDSDGSVNTTAAMYDPTKKIAYFVLARIDLHSFDENGLPCSGTKALVVGVDATNDSILDLNGSADGKGIELYMANPASATLSSDGNTITVLNFGCYAGGLTKQGVEQVHLDTVSRTIAYAPTDDNAPGDLIQLAGRQALLHAYRPDFSDVWNTLDLSTGIVGAQLNNVPDGAASDGTNVYGVTIADPSLAANVVSYDVATDTTTNIVASPWVGHYSAAATVALVQ
jgi:hypothetical protein